MQRSEEAESLASSIPLCREKSGCVPATRNTPLGVEIRVPPKYRSRFNRYLNNQSSGFFWAIRLVVALGLVVVSQSTAVAHAFGTPYNLPVPFWLYAYGASAALILSFLIVVYFVDVPAVAATPRDCTVLGPKTIWTLRAGSLTTLLLSIIAGLIGTRDASANINMTLYWIVFTLAFYYLTPFIGDLYNIINPWRSLCTCIEILSPSAFVGRIRYPERLSYWPALILYGAFIWIELFGETQPRSLAFILVAYTAINVAAAALIGKDAWFTFGEFLSVLYRLAGTLAPIQYVSTKDEHVVHLRLQKPLTACLDQSADRFALLVFILFSLSSTAFDGFHETLPWVSIFWLDIYPVLRSVLHRSYQELFAFYNYWQWTALILSPIFYLVVYLAFVYLAKVLARSKTSLASLALAFAYSLIPVALAYHAAHYFSLVTSQGTQIVRMTSDPFGFGWNLFGTAGWLDMPIILDAGTNWHAQVALIVLGHALGVYVAHVKALRIFASTRRALVSQLPLLLLMMIFTTVGLWILSLPIAAGKVLVPGGGNG
jgi:hypothetical protein